MKLLDLGLVRDTLGDNELTRGQGVKMLGTADYLAPEQAVDSSNVDTRADIYSLGATGYFLLTGKPPFPGEKVAQKLIAHQTKPVPLVSEARSDVPAELTAIIAKMMGKKPADRFQSPEELLEALEPWAAPVPPPTEHEIPSTVGGAAGNPTSAVNLGINLSRTSRSGSGGSSLNGSAIRYHSPDSNLTTTPRPGGPGSQIRSVGPRLASGSHPGSQSITASGSGRLGVSPGTPPSSKLLPPGVSKPVPTPTPGATPWKAPAAQTPAPPVAPPVVVPPAPPVTVPLVKANPPSNGFDAPALPAAVAYAAQPAPIPGAPQIANPFKTKTAESIALPPEVKADPKPAKAASPGCLRRWLSMVLACSLTVGVAAWDVMLITGSTAKSATPEAAKPAPPAPVAGHTGAQFASQTP